MTDQHGTVALVTGGSRGIGAATARVLAAAGCDVAIGYRERDDEAERVAADCRAEGGRALPVRADLAEPDALADLFAAVDAGLGRLSVLVNNAGMVPPLGRLDGFDAPRGSGACSTSTWSASCWRAARRCGVCRRGTTATVA